MISALPISPSVITSPLDDFRGAVLLLMGPVCCTLFLAALSAIVYVARIKQGRDVTRGPIAKSNLSEVIIKHYKLSLLVHPLEVRKIL